MRPLHMTEVARIRDSHAGPRAIGRRRREPVNMFGEPLTDVAHATTERHGLVGAEKFAVVLQCGTAPGGVHDDRRSERTAEIVDHATGKFFRALLATSMAVQGPAAATATAGQADGRSGAAHHPQRCLVDIALPSIHHATGEQDRIDGVLIGAETTLEDRNLRWKSEPIGE